MYYEPSSYPNVSLLGSAVRVCLGFTRNDSKRLLSSDPITRKEVQIQSYSKDTCFSAAQNRLSLRLLSGNEQIKICRHLILLVVLYSCETWFLTFKKGTQAKGV
jgi:hypothetical protein